MGELRVRSALVTGANRGIGLGFVRHLLALPNPPEWVFAGCRDPKGQRAQVRLGWAGAEVGDSRAAAGVGMCEGLRQGAAALDLGHRRTGAGCKQWGAQGSLGSRRELLPLPGTVCPRAGGKGLLLAEQIRVDKWSSHPLSSTGAAEIGLQAPQPGHRPAR